MGRRSRTIWATVLLSGLVVPSVVTAEPVAGEPAFGLRAVTKTYNYRGRLTTRIHYFNVCGGDQGSQRTSFRIRVTAGPPLRPEDQSSSTVGKETNAVHLAIGSSNVSDNASPGFVSIGSAQRFAGTFPAVILQYWRLRLHGKSLKGTLVEDHREEGAALNQLAAPAEIVPCQPQFGTYPNAYGIAEGATLRGKIDVGHVNLRIKGNVLDRTRPFVAKIVAQR